jgi:hypothetical protein
VLPERPVNIICATSSSPENRLQNALNHLGEAIHETEAALEEMRTESDPLVLLLGVTATFGLKFFVRRSA